MTTAEFIQEYREKDTRQLALQSARFPDVDMPYALDQIKGWQTARRKLPTWAACDGIVYPPHLSMEQCSSEPTAQYKLNLAMEWSCRIESSEFRVESSEREVESSELRVENSEGEVNNFSSGQPATLNSQLSTLNPQPATLNSQLSTLNPQPATLNSQLSTLNCHASRMTDLTGGFGVDFSFTSCAFASATYVERNAQLCHMVEHNLPLLGIDNAKVVCADAVDYLSTLDMQTMIFLDPARRDQHGAKTVMLADCTPDVVQLLPQLLKKSRFTMLKLSPMLDWHKAVEDLQGTVREVHIVSVGGECKELLLVLSEEIESELKVFCADLEAGGSGEAGLSGGSSSSSSSSLSSEPSFPRTPSSPSAPSHPSTHSLSASLFVYTPSTTTPAPNSKLKIQNSKFFHEPNASIMKAGCFDELAAAYGVSPVSRNSHLFLSAEPVDGFPGRSFSIERVTTLNKRELRQALAGIEKANIATRNFPLSVAELRKRLKLKDGGDVYIFATTTAEDEHLLLISHKYQ
ncbi:THUMP-like domain-containing protein [Leyella stercorea]|uniref:THUMP-like domain-containing protein n=1 Tax=Leyella stercorea TaxID=363265 RepID=UPI001F33EA21|nr:SAM-dependent methyltransferase [Leyella stercorea]MCF2614711.1 SAM-dependent methyltransferase [Leyella stercorea]